MTHMLVSILLVFVLCLPSLVLASRDVLPLMHAKELKGFVDFNRYWVTEKFDGVRAVWHGNELRTRSGRLINAPVSFLESLPDQTIEGELWLGYGQFDEISSLVRRKESLASEWENVHFLAFDLPLAVGDYQTRMLELDSIIDRSTGAHLKTIDRQQVGSQQELDQLMADTVEKGGEGLMLNDSLSIYQSKRSNAILKYKPKFDDEAEVIGHTAGKGKYQGQLGALVVKMADGRKFKIGTGFSDDIRKDPPAIGEWVTFEYSGLTSKGLPRFARFVRIYEQL